MKTLKALEAERDKLREIMKRRIAEIDEIKSKNRVKCTDTYWKKGCGAEYEE